MTGCPTATASSMFSSSALTMLSSLAEGVEAVFRVLTSRATAARPRSLGVGCRPPAAVAWAGAVGVEASREVTGRSGGVVARGVDRGPAGESSGGAAAWEEAARDEAGGEEAGDGVGEEAGDGVGEEAAGGPERADVGDGMPSTCASTPSTSLRA